MKVQAVSRGLPSGWSAPAAITLVDSDVGSAQVYPNPWRAAHGDGDIVFNRLPPNSTVKIFTVSARWIKSLRAPAGKVSWDLTNDTGEKMAAGLYLYLLTDNQGYNTRGKLAVIR